MVSLAKTPNELDFSSVSGYKFWFVGYVGMEPIAVVDCSGDCLLLRMIQSDEHSSLIGRCDIVASVRDCLQRLFDAGRLSDYSDLPSIRVFPI